jgi:hypothetical protein
LNALWRVSQDGVDHDAPVRERPLHGSQINVSSDRSGSKLAGRPRRVSADKLSLGLMVPVVSATLAAVQAKQRSAGAGILRHTAPDMTQITR